MKNIAPVILIKTPTRVFHPGAKGEDVQTKVPGEEGRETAPVGLHQHQDVQTHVLWCLQGQTLLCPQQVPHDQSELHLQNGLQRSVEDAMDLNLRVPEEVHGSRRHVF